MNVLIINPPIRLSDAPRHIPHGLAILANQIRKKLSITPYFLDINAHRYSDKKVEGILRSAEFDVVLIGGLIPVYKSIIQYADMIKGIKPDATIIAGGSAAMSVPELLLNNSKVDAICAGEGEDALIDLLRGLSSQKLAELTNIKGFYFKVGNEIFFSGQPKLISDLDFGSCLPAYDLLPMEIYLSNPIVGFGRDIDFISSRGCPFNCSFCYQPWGNKFRAHSPEFIIDGLTYLKKKFGIDFVSFQDDEFMANKVRVIEFCEKIQTAIPGILWSVTGRANLVEEDIVAEMRKAGCVSISYGFESGSPRMLESMKKKNTLAQMERAIRINRKFGMLLPVSFILGMPGENNRSCKETVDFCTNNNLPLKSMMFATPYPGTEIFDFALDTGRIEKENLHDYVMQLGDARDFLVNLTDAFSDDELILKRDEMIRQVGLKVPDLSPEVNEAKLKKLFGNLLLPEYNADKKLAQHRAQHGGIDIF